jgi:hypothetical protein
MDVVLNRVDYMQVALTSTNCLAVLPHGDGAEKHTQKVTSGALLVTTKHHNLLSRVAELHWSLSYCTTALGTLPVTSFSFVDFLSCLDSDVAEFLRF